MYVCVRERVRGGGGERASARARARAGERAHLSPGALTLHTVVEQLVWAHMRGPGEARAVAAEISAAHCHRSACNLGACLVCTVY